MIQTASISEPGPASSLEPSPEPLPDVPRASTSSGPANSEGVPFTSSGRCTDTKVGSSGHDWIGQSSRRSQPAQTPFARFSTWYRLKP